MSDKYIEKAFLYFIALSLLFHVAAGVVLYLMPEKKRDAKPESYMVELSDIPTLHEAPQKGVKTKRYGERKRRVERETAPKGNSARNLARLFPPPATDGHPKFPSTRTERVPNPLSVPDGGARTGSPTVKKFPELDKLFPSAERMSTLEEGYRKQYDNEIEEGDTLFLNTDDIKFGSFLRRFETAVYGVWTYPAAAVRAGIQGVTPVRITFNRKGEIENIQLLRSSGSRLLDDEVFRALRSLGPIGSFPKNYAKDHFNLIAFFEYGLGGGAFRGIR